MVAYCECEPPVMDVMHDAGCRRCGLPVDFSPRTRSCCAACGGGPGSSYPDTSCSECDPFGFSNIAAAVLVDIADSTWRKETPAKRVAARAELVRRNECSDCGASAGRECKPDYGCVNASRVPKVAAMREP